MINRKNKINDEVRFPQVRVIGDGDSQIMSSREAYYLAKSNNLDLILINENQNPPVVKIADYQKHLYLQEKTEKERAKNTKFEIKEIQLSCDIAENDLKTKANHAIRFLQKGNRVKVVLTMLGRQKNTPHRGEATMLNFESRISEYALIESAMNYDGNRWIAIYRKK